MPQVKVSTILQLVKILGGREMVVELPDGATVAELMRVLAEHSDAPAAPLLLTGPGGGLNPSISVMVNGRNLMFLRGLETPLAQDDQVTILPAVGAG